MARRSETFSVTSTTYLLPSSTYIRSGIGGMGNYHHRDSLSKLQANSSNDTINTPRSSSSSMSSVDKVGRRSSTPSTVGIGGAGNISEAQRLNSLPPPPQREVQKQPMGKRNKWFIGIGGSGNQRTV